MNEFIGLPPGLSLEGPIPQQVLLETCCTATCLHLSPSGGEQHGNVLLASVNKHEIPEIENALVALWKLTLCIGEDWEYARWSETERDRRLGWSGRAEWTAFTNASCESTDKFLHWLLGRCRETVEAQQTLERPVNAPVYWPDATAVVATELELLNYITSDALVGVLSDAWNSPIGLFQDDDTYYWAEWMTSA
jgi:hypothetical protein